MNPDAKAQLVRAYRAACTAADTARSATDAALVALLGCPPADQREVADQLRHRLNTQRDADATCAALAAQLHQTDTRIRAFPTWADDDTPAWRWLLALIEQESAQLTMI